MTATFPQSFRPSHPAIAFAAAAALLLAGCQQPPRPTAASLTVYPVLLADHANADAATVLGSLIERGGMPEVVVGEHAFTPVPDTDAAARAAAFAAFVKRTPPASERALFVDVRGSRAEGIAAVDSVLVDRDGTVLWQDHQTPGSAAFDARPPREPLDCCVLVAQRLREPLGLADPWRAGAEEGRLGRLLKQDAGMPSPTEQRDIAARLAALRALGERAPIRVQAPRVGTAWRQQDAEEIARQLRAGGFAATVAAARPLAFATRASSNEQTVLWSGARDLQRAVRAAAATDQYLLATDVLMASEHNVGAVHCYLLAPNGDVVWVDHQNDHHADFQRLAAKAPADAVALIVKRTLGALRR